MDWERFNEETRPAMDFLRTVYRDNISELASLECAQAEMNLDIIIDALVKLENWLEYEIASLRSFKKVVDFEKDMDQADFHKFDSEQGIYL